jgi:hypothetical protein
MIAALKEDKEPFLEQYPLVRVEYLQRLQEEMGAPLAPQLLAPSEAERIARARSAYKMLRAAYEPPSAPEVALIPDLILATEEELEQAISQIAAQKGKLVPALIALLQAHDFYDILFPGFGQAPARAARCLGTIGDERALKPLFEALGLGDFDNEESILQALGAMPNVAVPFLLKVVHSQPITQDNIRAAMALSTFSEDSAIAEGSLQVLSHIDCNRHSLLATYLILNCAALQDPKLRAQFVQVCRTASLSPELQPDFERICRGWDLPPKKG